MSILRRIRPLRAIAAETNRERLLWAVRVRWLAIGGFSILALLAAMAGVLSSLDSSAVAAAASAALNAANHWCVARWRYVRTVTALVIPADVFLITYLIVHTGGAQSPFIMLYVVQVVATAMLVDLVIAAAGALASAGCFLMALSLQPVAADAAGAHAHGSAYQIIWGLFLLYCLGLLTYLGGYIAERLRRSEGDLAERNAHLRGALASLEGAHADLQRTVERLRSTEAQLVQSEKTRALGQFVAGIAHELNNPIGFVSGNLDHLRRAVGALEQMLAAYAETPVASTAEPVLAARRQALRVDALLADLPSVLQDCEEGARRAAEIVAALRTFARGDAHGAWSCIDVRDRIERTLALLRHRLIDGIAVVGDYGDVPQLECIPGQLDQVWLNVLANAIEAVGKRGMIRVSTRVEPAPRQPQRAGHMPSWRCATTASACPRRSAPHLRSVLSPPSPGQGVGLGLSVCTGSSNATAAPSPSTRCLDGVRPLPCACRSGARRPGAEKSTLDCVAVKPMIRFYPVW
jgi:signal transduction histidine kinase